MGREGTLVLVYGVPAGHRVLSVCPWGGEQSRQESLLAWSPVLGQASQYRGISLAVMGKRKAQGIHPAGGEGLMQGGVVGGGWFPDGFKKPS